MTDEINNDLPEETAVEKVPVIGQYSLPGVIGFSTLHGVVRVNAEDAYIEGKHFSGMMDHLVFKLTIRDNETVDFEEMETSETTAEDRGRLLEKFTDSEPIVGKLGGMYNPDEFTFISTVESKLAQKQVPLYLLTKFKTSADRLGDIAYEDNVVVDESAKQSVKDFLNSLDLTDEDLPGVTPKEEETPVVEVPLVDEEINDLKVSKEELIEKGIIERDELGNALLESNEHVKKELNGRIARKEKELEENAKRKEKIAEELTELQNRVKNIDKVAVSNGMLFCVSEEIQDENPDYIFEKDVIAAIENKLKKIPNINSEAFIALFKAGKYIITLGDSDGNFLKEDAQITLPKDVRLEKGKIIYAGEKQWHDIVEEMLELGYGQDADFDKKAGSNSYVFTETLNPELPNPSTLSNPGQPLTLKQRIVKFYNSIIARVKSWF